MWLETTIYIEVGLDKQSYLEAFLIAFITALLVAFLFCLLFIYFTKKTKRKKTKQQQDKNELKRLLGTKIAAMTLQQLEEMLNMSSDLSLPQLRKVTFQLEKHLTTKPRNNLKANDLFSVYLPLTNHLARLGDKFLHSVIKRLWLLEMRYCLQEAHDFLRAVDFFDGSAKPVKEIAKALRLSNKFTFQKTNGTLFFNLTDGKEFCEFWVELKQAFFYQSKPQKFPKRSVKKH